MMHNFWLPRFYHFIDNLNTKNIDHLNNDIALIFRNYQHSIDIDQLKKFRDFCKKSKQKFLISNNINLAFKLSLDGVYLPSFNKSFLLKNYKSIKNFIIIGSAHNLKEIKIKEAQKVMQIFISPIFKKTLKNKKLGIINLNNICKHTNIPIIALGGVNEKNISNLKMTKIKGFAAINYFRKKNINNE